MEPQADNEEAIWLLRSDAPGDPLFWAWATDEAGTAVALATAWRTPIEAVLAQTKLREAGCEHTRVSREPPPLCS